MSHSIIPVQFYNDTLAIVEHQGQPFVPMKPIVENMGLDWKSQHVKLGEKFNSTMVIITMVAEDGKNREMICMPMRKIPAWLYSINPNKVAPHVKDNIIRYQERCDDVLWEYWSTGRVVGKNSGKPTINEQLAANRELNRLMELLKKETNPTIRVTIDAQIQHVAHLADVPAPNANLIGKAIEPNEPHPLVEEFWEMIDRLGLENLNHSQESGVYAINILEFAEAAKAAGLMVPRLADLRRALKDCTTPQFSCIKSVRNYKEDNKTIKCWLFNEVAK